MTRDTSGADAMAQSQFLTILSREDAIARWTSALDPKPRVKEAVVLEAAQGRVLARSVKAPIDVPPFDRSLVDGFAVRSEDVAGASERSPVRLLLNAERIACGVSPAMTVEPGTATLIATGSPPPRGADSVIMIEHTDPDGGDGILVRRAATPGAYIGFAGGDVARGETLLRAGALLGPRELAMLAACGVATVEVWQKPRVAVLSTGDELVVPGEQLRPAAVYDSNGIAISAILRENGCDPVFLGVVADDAAALEKALFAAKSECDAIVLSAGTSKGAGDLTYKIIAHLGSPGIIAHGVALKPGKPLCLAVCDGKPVVALPGFPTSAMFTLQNVVVPVFRNLAGLPTQPEQTIEAEVAVRIASEIGRTEFAMVSLVENDGRLKAYASSAGSGAVTTFARADGFLTIDALADHMPAGTKAAITLLGNAVRAPDLTIIGSHCVGLDCLVDRLAELGIKVRVIAVGSQGGLAALQRGEADLAPIHLLDPASSTYNRPFLDDDMELVPGWRRSQGLLFRTGDARFGRSTPEEAVLAAADVPTCLMVNRNAGAGTRILIDKLLAGRRPQGYANQPKSHNAVAAAIAQGRADWGIAIKQAADAYRLAFQPILDEHFDFAVLARPRRPDLIATVRAILADEQTRSALGALGFRPAD